MSFRVTEQERAFIEDVVQRSGAKTASDAFHIILSDAMRLDVGGYGDPEEQRRQPTRRKFTSMQNSDRDADYEKDNNSFDCDVPISHHRQYAVMELLLMNTLRNADVLRKKVEYLENLLAAQAGMTTPYYYMPAMLTSSSKSEDFVDSLTTWNGKMLSLKNSIKSLQRW